MNSRNCLFKYILLLLIAFSYCGKNELYDDNNSNVINLNKKNFDTQITLNRSKNIVSLIHFYKMDDGKSSGMKKEFEKLATEYDLMFKVAAINCNQFKDLCEKHDVKEFPLIKVFPPLPAPVMVYEGKLETSALVSYMGKFLGNKAQELNNNNIDNFLSTNPNLPKCLLFTDKKGIALIFKALSVSFDKKIEFGVVRSEDTAITSKYKVTKFPKIVVIGVDKKIRNYDGENKFKPLFDFLNVFSETFFRVGEDKAKPTDQTKQEKPWLNEKLPELTKESANEICFKVDGVVCVLLINKEKPDDTLINLYVGLQNWLSPKINRGLKYKFGWINSTTQTQFMQAINMETGSGPTLALVNPGKRRRFYILDNAMTEQNMRGVFERLASGDIRFLNFKGNNIPDLE